MLEDRQSSILVVDDNEANRALALHTLEDEGYRVVLADSGPEAIAAFERETPDCILLDVRMPEMDGFAVCERIRTMPHGPETPIIFLTALRDVDTFDHALRAGGDDFLTKPVRPTELLVRVQSALKLRRMSLELREHYDLLRRQRDDLVRLQLQKERLMAFVVHDLKNPVNAMDLHAQMLLREKNLPESTRVSVSHIRTSARELTRMILNLLDISKADEGRLAPKLADIDAGALVDEVLAELEPLAASRKVALTRSVAAAYLRGDADLLQRMLANLLENAIRHAPKVSTVDVAVCENEGATTIRVTDSGSGVPPDMREKIFGAFVQVEDSRGPTTLGGRGLGLAFCRLVAEAHGGRIWVEDCAPGSMFCVGLPSPIAAPLMQCESRAPSTTLR